MKALTTILIVVAAISAVVGVISRLAMVPVLPVGLTAAAFFGFADTCLLLAIALALVKK